VDETSTLEQSFVVEDPGRIVNASPGLVIFKLDHFS
jgi:hypothetical protein